MDCTADDKLVIISSYHPIGNKGPSSDKFEQDHFIFSLIEKHAPDVEKCLLHFPWKYYKMVVLFM